jgi:hypothetical protein
MAKKRIRKDQVNGIYAYTQEDKLFARCLMEAHQYISNEIGVNVPLHYERKHIFGPAAPYFGCYSPSTQVCTFNFSANYGQTLRSALETIGHELRHALQYDKGWYAGHTERRQRWGKQLIGNWKGEEYKGDYINAPWEIDARGFQQHYAEMTHRLFTEAELNTVLPVYRPKKSTK